jgi:hypothetical protein
MKIAFNVTVFLFMCLAIVGCKKYDTDYKSFLDNHEVTYPGLASGLNYHAGNLRTVLVWHPSPDPSIKRYVILWNSGRDSLLLNATNHDPADSVVVSIPNLQEYVYSFHILTYDKDNNASVGQDINNVRVYGPAYQSTLLNRGYDNSKPYTLNADGSVDLNFLKADTGNVGTTINYTTNAGLAKTVVLAPNKNVANLPDFKYDGAVTYQSSYIPVVLAADTFKVNSVATFPTVKLVGDITSLFLKNPGRNIVRSDNGTDKWGLAKDWLYNTAVVNQDGNTGGGWSTDDGGVIHFETRDWSGDGVSNGKMYQTFTLPAGNYHVDFESGNYGGTFNVNELAVTGTTLPDITDLGTPLDIFKGDQNNLSGTHTLNFKLTQQTTIAVGWVINTGQYTYVQFRSIKLRRDDQ